MIKTWLKRLKRGKSEAGNPRSVVLSKMPKHSVCAEIGTWKGDFARRILNTVVPTELYLIDPYQHMPQYQHAWYGGVAEGGQDEMDAIYHQVESRFIEEIGLGVVHLKRMTAQEAMSEFPEEYLDWVYIDGNHSYEFVKADLADSWRKVKSGGFITGDDYRKGGWWKEGVIRAVDEFLAEHKNNISEFTLVKTQYIIQKG